MTTPRMTFSDFWGSYEANTRRQAQEALDELDALSQSTSADIGTLQAQVKRVRTVVEAQGQRMHRLELAVSVIGQLLLEQGTLGAGVLEARIEEAMKAEQAQREEQVARAEAATAEAARKQQELAKASENAPTRCHSCGKTFAYHTGFMSERGMICSDCFQRQEG